MSSLKDTTPEPFTYLFPQPNSTTRTGGHGRPHLPVFNWLLIDSAMAAGDNKLPPAWQGEVADKLSIGVGVDVIHRASNLSLHYLYISFLFM